MMEAQDVIGLVLVYLIIAASLGVSHYCRKKGYDVDYRKIVHAGVGLFVLVWWMFTESWIMLLFFTVPFAIVLFIAMFDGNRVSDSELGDISNKMGHRAGLFLYVISINLLVLFFFDGHWTAATIGIAAMTFGDSAGSVIGRRYGRHKTVNGKSAEGSLAVFAMTAVSAVALILFYAYLSSEGLFAGTADPSVNILAAGAAAGVVASLSEMLCPGQLDNIANPMLVALAMVALGL